MRVLVTRPAREATGWVMALREQGLDAVALPLITIDPVDDSAPVQAAWQRLDQYSAVMFVSANAVEHFFVQAVPRVLAAWRNGSLAVRAWSPGPGTRKALLAAGLPPQAVDAPAQDAAQFDSESLWQQVASQVKPSSRILLVRGADASGEGAGRDWLSGQLQAAGAVVETVPAYARRPPLLDDQQRALASQAASDGSVWLFSSSEALSHLRAALPAQSWRRARAVATHPRIALALEEAGFAVVCRSRPDLGDIVAALKSSR